MSKLSELIPYCRKILLDVARAGETITYSELAERLGAKIHQGHWEKILDPIWRENEAAGVPDFTYVVVYKSGPKKGLGAYLADGEDKYPLDPMNPDHVASFGRHLAEVHRFYRDAEPDMPDS